MAGNGVEVVGGQEDRHTLPVQLVQEVQNVMLSFQVHAGSGFIEQQELGSGDQSPGQEDTLLLSARELADMPPGIGCQAKAIEECGNLATIGALAQGQLLVRRYRPMSTTCSAVTGKAPVDHLTLWHIAHGHLR